MKFEKKLKKDLHDIPTPDIDAVLPNAHRTTATYTPTPRRRKWLTAPIAVAMACMLTFGAAAAGVTAVVQYLNRDIIAENTQQLTSVPEGYAGIYTAADLVQMAEDIRNGTGANNYILMDDITFTDADFAEGGICEGGWIPVDTYYHGTYEHQVGVYSIWHTLDSFHGNGHVIRNLKITTSAPIPEHSYLYKDLYVGLFGTTSAEITHLGIENCEIVISETITKPFASYDPQNDVTLGTTLHVGAIAGHADYIGGCYVSGLDIHLTSAFEWNEVNMSEKEKFFDTAFYNLNVGGIAGSTTYADACYAEDVNIRVHTEGEPYAKLYAGLLAGRATSCVTSWAQGNIETTGDGYREQNTADIACNYPSHSFPTVIPAQAFEELLATVDSYYGEGDFYTKLIRAYFVIKDANSPYFVSEEQQAAIKALVEGFNDRYAFVSGDPETEYTAFYIFDEASSPLELERIGTLICKAFETEEAYLDFCHAHNIRMGLLACRTIAPDERVTESDLEHFNLETLWHIVDGKPRLQIFSE